MLPDSTKAGAYKALGIVLAAGQGKRMQTQRPKVAHTLLGRPLILWATEALRKSGIEEICVVVSPQQAEVQAIIQEFEDKNQSVALLRAFQAQAQGTGHAAKIGLSALSQHCLAKGIDLGSQEQPFQILIATGDTPLLNPQTLRDFLNFHDQGKFESSLIAFEAENPKGYGRILRDTDDRFIAIREEKDCSAAEREVKLCNSGILCVQSWRLKALLDEVGNSNASGEYYLTDVPGLSCRSGARVGVYIGSDRSEFDGVNTQAQLAQAAAVLQERIIVRAMAQGVQFEAPRSVYLEDGVEFGSDVIVEPFVCLRGHQKIADMSRVKTGTGFQNC